MLDKRRLVHITAPAVMFSVNAKTDVVTSKINVQIVQKMFCVIAVSKELPLKILSQDVRIRPIFGLYRYRCQRFVYVAYMRMHKYIHVDTQLKRQMDESRI